MEWSQFHSAVLVVSGRDMQCRCYFGRAVVLIPVAIVIELDVRGPGLLFHVSNVRPISGMKKEAFVVAIEVEV